MTANAVEGEIFDLLVVGAGPTGLACAIEAQKEGLRAVLVDKGCVCNSLFHYPAHMTFFTTPELLEIGGIPDVYKRQGLRMQRGRRWNQRTFRRHLGRDRGPRLANNFSPRRGQWMRGCHLHGMQAERGPGTGEEDWNT